MRIRPTALGYLRTDVSGVAQLWDEAQIRGLAKRLGYDFSGMVVFDPRTERPPLARLRAQLTRLDAEAVITSSTAHFDDDRALADLVRTVDVITVNPENTYARWLLPPISTGDTAMEGGM